MFTTTFYLGSVCRGWPLSIIQNMINGGRSWNEFDKLKKNSSSQHCSLFTIQILINGVDEETGCFFIKKKNYYYSSYHC